MAYDYWFKSMEQALSGRGKMGSLVGASEEVKRAGGIDINLNEYAVRVYLGLHIYTSSRITHKALQFGPHCRDPVLPG